MKAPIILTHIKDRVGYITLNRPEKRNAINPEMVEELGKAFNFFERNEEVKVVVLQASGTAFCAGADLEYIQQLQNFSFEENLQDSQNLKNLFQQIYEFPKVVIAKVEGHALAGGCGLVTVCDFAYSVPEALLGYTEVRIGFIPALVSVFLAEKIGFGQCAELLLSGEIFPAEKAFQFKLITEVVPSEQMDNKVEEFCRKLVIENSANSMEQTKKLLRSINKTKRTEALENATLLNAQTRSHEDCKKGIAAFLNKSKPYW